MASRPSNSVFKAGLSSRYCSIAAWSSQAQSALRRATADSARINVSALPPNSSAVRSASPRSATSNCARNSVPVARMTRLDVPTAVSSPVATTTATRRNFNEVSQNGSFMSDIATRAGGLQR